MFGIYMNYWSVLVAAVAAHFVGWLWYGLLFGKKWIELRGPAGEGAKKSMSAKAWGFVSTFVLAWGLAYVLGASGIIFDLTGAMVMAFIIWLAFVATTLAHGWLWEGKSGKFFVFKLAHQLVSILVMALVLVLW